MAGWNGGRNEDMSTLAQHQHHIDALHDIRDIMTALKNISLTETQRLRRFLANQHRAMDGIERALGDFLGHFALNVPWRDTDMDIVLLVGSERGFCGDFNESLLNYLEPAAKQGRLIAIGEKLISKLDDLQIEAEAVTGLSTVEDVSQTILKIVDKLRDLTSHYGSIKLTFIHHYYDGQTFEVRRHQPFRHLATAARRFGYPPLLNIEPEAFFPQLLDHYLFAILHDVLYGSLAAEHQQRLQHLQGAIEHIDRQCATMEQRYNNLRQELITEEIELIILSAEVYMRE
jgi:F-type H+-transporting ATPase subunit gamma